MFKLFVPITKSYQKSDNPHIMVIEWMATDPSIDRDNERFSKEAVEMMKDSVNAGEIPIRVEHENKFYTDVGVWKEASMWPDNKVYVKGEVDTRLSLGNDLKILTEMGKSFGLSVGGKVLNSIYEYSKDLGKNIKVYTEVLLKEISVVKNPSNYNATLSVSKSYDVENNKQTEEAIALEKSSASMYKVDQAEFQTPLQYITFEKNMKNKVALKSYEEVVGYMSSLIQQKAEKDVNTYVSENQEEVLESSEKGCDEYCYYADDAVYYVVNQGLDQEDIQLIITLSEIVRSLEGQTIECPKEFKDDAYYETVCELPMESFIIGIDWKLFPHHNADFTLNMKWLTYWLFKLINGDYSYLTPKEYNIALNHLYHHYKQEMLKKSTKKIDINFVTKNETVTITAEDIQVMEACYKFSVHKEGNRPQIAGNDLSDVEVAKMVDAYMAMMQRKASNRSFTQTGDATRKPISTDQSGVGEGQVAVNKDETTEEETTEKAEEVATNAPSAEDVKTEEATEATTEEATTEETSKNSEETTDNEWDVSEDSVSGEDDSDASVNQIAEKSEETDEDATAEDSEKEAEDTEKNSEEAEESTDEDAKEEEATVEDAEKATKEAEEATLKATVTGVVTDLFDKFLQEKLSPMIDTLTKQVSDLKQEVEKSQESMEKSAGMKEDKLANLETILTKQADVIKAQGETLADFGKKALGRKSFASFQALEKSFTGQEVEAKTLEDEVTKYMDDHNVGFAKARSAVLKAKQAQ